MPNKGDKYIIRKLISFKIVPEQIQDFVNKVTSITTNGNSGNYNSMQGYQMSYPNYSSNVNQFGYVDPTMMQFPQNSFGPMQPNLMNMNNPSLNLLNNQNMGMGDDAQLVQNFAQMSLMNQNFANFGIPQPSNYNSCKNLDMGLGGDGSNNDNSNGNFGNYEGQLSSVPPHMKTSKLTRSNSISGVPSSSGFSKIDLSNNSVNNSSYMNEAFLFEKFGQKMSKDDSSFCKCNSTTAVDPIISQPLLPPSMKLRKAESDLLSNSSYSSKSSVLSFNDNVSCSSLDLSFDGSGKPYLKNPPKVSAFAKVKGGTEANDSVSEDDDSMDPNNSSSEKRVRSNHVSPSRPGNKKKSSFFRLKNVESSEEG